MTTDVTANPRTDTAGTAGVFYPDGAMAVTAPYALRFPTYATQYCFVGSDQPFNKINITVSVANIIDPSAISAQYWNGSAWTTISVTDTTKVGTVTLSQSGYISFTPPSDWKHSASTTTPTGPVSTYIG